MKFRTQVVVDVDEASLISDLSSEDLFQDAILNRFDGTAFHIILIYSTKEEDES